MKNNYLYDAFFEKFIDSSSSNFSTFNLTQHLLANNFNLQDALDSAPEGLPKSEINFLTNCCKLSREEFSNLRINLIRGIS